MSLTFQICVILAVFPVIFLYYLKHHPEKIDEYAVRPTRQKIVHKLLFWFLGFSVFSVYLLAFSIGLVWLPLILPWLTVSDFQPG